MLFRFFGAVVLLVCIASCNVTAIRLVGQDDSQVQSNWHQFRGPTGNGISTTAKPPTVWTNTKNVKWKAEIPGNGTGSPVVWEDRVFVVTAIPVETEKTTEAPERLTRDQIVEKFDADKDGNLDDSERQSATEYMQEQSRKSIKIQQFVVMCFDRNKGTRLWDKIAIEAKPGDTHHQDHGYASASPITDGKHVFAFFGSQGIFCYDFDGQLIWKRTDLGTMQTRGSFGEGSSLALFQNKLIMPWDHEGQSHIEVIAKDTGKTLWKKNRDETSNWITPRVVMVNSRAQVIQGGEQFTTAYDLETGEEIWKATGLTGRPVASPVVKDNIAVYASSRGGAAMHAFKLDRKGDISNDGKAWSITEQTPDCPSLALSGNRIYFVAQNKANISCANIDSGEIFFGPKRLTGLNGVYSSPVVADGKVFVTGRNGITAVMNDSSEFNLIQTNDIGEPVDATIALAGNQLFIRGRNHVFCIEE